MFEKDEKFEGSKPDFSNTRFGVSIWTNQDKNGKPYLTVKIPLLNMTVSCFKAFEEKKEENVNKDKVTEEKVDE